MSKKKDKTENVEEIQDVESPDSAEDIEEVLPDILEGPETSAQVISDVDVDTGSVSEATEIEDAPRTEEPAIELEEEEEAEEPSSSLSSKVLKGLFLILLGMVIALWGAPKLAPMLPQGLAPVATFLTPGQTQAEADIAALKSELEARVSALESKPGVEISEESVEHAIQEYADDLRTEIGLIKDKLGATDGEAIEARLAKLETQITGITAELSSMSDRLSLQITENGAALSEEAAAKLAGYQAVMDGLKAQVDDLAAKNGALNQKVEEVAAASARRVQEAEDDAAAKVTNTATKKLLTDIIAALDSGAPFQPALDGLSEVSDVAIPQALTDVAATGTPGRIELRSKFPEAAHAALRADTSANANEGVFGKLGAFLQNQVGTRSTERKEGNDTDAILSRIEDDLSRGNFQSAVTEANSLAEAPKEAMAEWLSDLTRLADAQSAFSELSSALGVAN